MEQRIPKDLRLHETTTTATTTTTPTTTTRKKKKNTTTTSDQAFPIRRSTLPGQAVRVLRFPPVFAGNIKEGVWEIGCRTPAHRDLRFSNGAVGSLSSISNIKMARNSVSLVQLQQRAAEADALISSLKVQLADLRQKTMSKACEEKEKQLRAENKKLEQEISLVKEQLIKAEIRNGLQQVLVSPEGPPTHVAAPPITSPKDTQKMVKVKSENKAEKKDKEKKIAAPDQKPVDISRLDLRVGLILEAHRHPDADTLYVESIDVGEATPRTIISGLVQHIPLEQMQKRLVVVLCNLKPVKMRGIVSQGMVMCASSPDKVEILDPPGDSLPGERVTCRSFTGEPDKELNPKKKVWEAVQPELRTNKHRAATYKGVPFEVQERGIYMQHLHENPDTTCPISC
uniref:Aminoacyl tRNA synthetase complex interacting multifunctional protein 1a n=1 Tax=Eptatretus burgeri TaxID=7764 RepID=A0A8C4NLP0_EPTBU